MTDDRLLQHLRASLELLLEFEAADHQPPETYEGERRDRAAQTAALRQQIAELTATP